jgi:hypothetical protein
MKLDEILNSQKASAPVASTVKPVTQKSGILKLSDILSQQPSTPSPIQEVAPAVPKVRTVTNDDNTIKGWNDRGYSQIPEEAPPELEAKCWAPSWRRMCKVLLRNDYWCKGLGQTQPKSEAYVKYKQIMKVKKELESGNHQ